MFNMVVVWSLGLIYDRAQWYTSRRTRVLLRFTVRSLVKKKRKKKLKTCLNIFAERRKKIKYKIEDTFIRS